MPFIAGRSPESSVCTTCHQTITPPLGHTLAEAESQHKCEYYVSVAMPMFEIYEDIATFLAETSKDIKPVN